MEERLMVGRSIFPTSILISILVFSCERTLGSTDNPMMGYTETQFDSLAHHLGKELSKLTTEEVEKRGQTRREFQRRGYQHVLAEIIRGDGLNSLLSFLRMRLHLELFLPHNTIHITQLVPALLLAVPIVFVYDGGTTLIFETGKVKLAIKEDWTFPVDPWKRESK